MTMIYQNLFKFDEYQSHIHIKKSIFFTENVMANAQQVHLNILHLITKKTE